VVVVGDAHLGSANPADEAAFHDFLAALPDLATSLVVVGDLFDFWFEYRPVIPRRPFKTLAKLASLVERGIPVTMFGGNHDRWGGSFWSRDLGIPFYPGGAELTLAGHRTWVIHGDGVSDVKLGARLLHRLLSSRVTTAVFGALHPTCGFALADALSGTLGEANRSGAAAEAAARAQDAWARTLLGQRPDLALVVAGHTHRRALVEVAPRRWYLNAGQWMVDREYAVVTEAGVTLEKWPAGPR